MNDFLNISDSCLRADPLESVFNDMRTVHLFVHLHFVVLAPHLLYHEIFSHFNFILIFILISRGLRDLTLSLDSVHPLL